MVVEKDRTVVVGEDAAAYLDAGDSLVQQPPRRPSLGFRHDAECKCLPYGLRPLDRVIDKTEVVLPFGRLKIGPGPSDVSDGRARVLAWRQWIPNAEMKVGEPHSGVKEYVVDFLRVDGHRLSRDGLAASLRMRTFDRQTGTG